MPARQDQCRGASLLIKSSPARRLCRRPLYRKKVTCISGLNPSSFAWGWQHCPRSPRQPAPPSRNHPWRRNMPNGMPGRAGNATVRRKSQPGLKAHRPQTAMTGSWQPSARRPMPPKPPAPASLATTSRRAESRSMPTGSGLLLRYEESMNRARERTKRLANASGLSRRPGRHENMLQGQGTDAKPQAPGG